MWTDLFNNGLPGSNDEIKTNYFVVPVKYGEIDYETIQIALGYAEDSSDWSKLSEEKGSLWISKTKMASKYKLLYKCYDTV